MTFDRMCAVVLTLGIGLITVAGQAFAAPYGGSAAAPKAFHAFCAKHPSQCRASGKSSAHVKLDGHRMKQLRSVNRQINRSVREVADKVNWGKADIWSIVSPGQSGDCEDFALTKRKRLIDLGWPSSALLITVVRTRRGQGHAVLTVRTTDGYLILDNKKSSIRKARSTGYYYYTMQSPSNPRSWVRIPVRGPVITDKVTASIRN